MKLNKHKLGGFEKFNRVTPHTHFIISTIFIILAVICIMPVVLVFMVSISSEQSIQQVGYRFWPEEFSLEAYSYLYNSKDSILRSFGISILVTVLGTIVGLILNTTIAYALSRKNFKLKSFLHGLYLSLCYLMVV